MTLNKLFALVDESRKTGRPIQYQTGPGDAWQTLDLDGDYSFSVDYRYRVAPPEPPKPRDFWMIPGRKEGEFLAYPDDGKTPREHWKQAGYTLVREVMEDSKS